MSDRPRPDLWRALGVLAEPPEPANVPVAEALDLPPLPDAAAYEEIFLFQLYPYASVYVGAEGMVGGEARARIDGFWRAVGAEPPAEPDHLAALLGLYVALAERAEDEKDRARGALASSARDALFREHIACWVTPYLVKVRESASPFYAQWAELLLGVVGAEEARMKDGALPLHLRSAPPLDDGQLDSPRALVRALLTPVRSGMILTRADLHACAAELGVGAIRMSERAMLLEELLRADPDRVLAWLISQLDRWVTRHEEWEAVGGGSPVFWRTRAASLRRMLHATRSRDLTS